MVIQDDGEAPIEVPIMKPISKNKKLIIVKNHVREVLLLKKDPSLNAKKSEFASENVPQKNPEDQPNPIKKGDIPRNLNYSKNLSSPNEISEADLHELKTVYAQCKAVVQKIERKYGHLLDIDNTTHRRRKTRNNSTDNDESSSESECTCEKNKKVVFDENGTSSMRESEWSCHVCPKRSKRNNSTVETSRHCSGLQLEYDDDITLSLPDDLTELGSILKDPSISITYRNRVIQKAKFVRQEQSNSIRFNKQFLIEKLKTNPEEILEFKGSNLFSLTGYQ